MDNKLAAIAKMIDDAIRVAETEAKKNAVLRESYELAAKNLGEIKEGLLSGKIQRPSGGATLGVGRNVGEFDEGELYRLGNKIDLFYRDEL